MWFCPGPASQVKLTLQYRPSLSTGSWQTLKSTLPASSGTNLTVFVHSNVVQNANCGGGGSFALMCEDGGEVTSVSMTVADTEPAVPLAMPADGSGSAVPLCLYPAGFDFSNFVILNPDSGEWVSASVYLPSPLSLDTPQLNDIEPLDGSGGAAQADSGTEDPDPGFYRVVRNDVHLFGFTNGMVLSGTVNVPVEFSVASADQIAGLTFYSNGSPLIGASAQGYGMQ